MDSSKPDCPEPDLDPQNNLQEGTPKSPVESVTRPERKPTMSKREIMEELSRQRFPWEE